jgi:hypothetical protein
MINFLSSKERLAPLLSCGKRAGGAGDMGRTTPGVKDTSEYSNNFSKRPATINFYPAKNAWHHFACHAVSVRVARATQGERLRKNTAAISPEARSYIRPARSSGRF